MVVTFDEIYSQEELLRKYCALNDIAVREVYVEDHSAKSFDRPAWKTLIWKLRRYRGKTDLLLFLKWDRFSRNAGDAYFMIATLRKYGVEPQAIEQPLDLSIPENKMMLAFYLAAPEVENDRRALNIIDGMRRARKEGRWMGSAPYGYINKIDDSRRKYIEIDKSREDLIRWIFQEVANDVYNVQQIYVKAKDKGFNGARSLFWSIIRSPVYCGKIFIQQYKNEESLYAKGQHEPIITEQLFFKVQEILDKRSRGDYKVKYISKDQLPLRGFIQCPQCSNTLSGSTSKGRSDYYSYYHCTGKCRFRVNAVTINNQFLSILKKSVPKASLISIYKKAIQDEWTKFKIDSTLQQQTISEIREIENKTQYIRELLSAREIDPDDYREMKSGFNEKLAKLKAILDMSSMQTDNIKELLDKAMKSLSRLETMFLTEDIEKQRKIVGSMYPGKLYFENNALRTANKNTIVDLIHMIDNKLEDKKRGQKTLSRFLSSQVENIGFEPITSSLPAKRSSQMS